MIYAENILICIAVPLVIALMFLRGGGRKFVVTFLLGMVVCLLSAYMSGFCQNVFDLSAEETSVFISPITEEIMKLLPIMFYLYIIETKGEEILFVAVGIGAGFATFENACHILSSGSQNLYYILVRGAAVGVMHLVTMVVLAMGLNLLKDYKTFSLAGILGALSLAMTVHALYNLLVSRPGASTYIGYAFPLILVIIFWVLRYLYLNKRAEKYS